MSKLDDFQNESIDLEASWWRVVFWVVIIGFSLILSFKVFANVDPVLEGTPCAYIGHPKAKPGDAVMLGKRKIFLNAGCYALTASEMQALHDHGFTIRWRFE